MRWTGWARGGRWGDEVGLAHGAESPILGSIAVTTRFLLHTIEQCEKMWKTCRAKAGDPLRFWGSIAGSVSKGAKHRVRQLADRVDNSGSVIGMLAWTEMIRLAQYGQLDTDRMAGLFASDSELTVGDLS